MTIQIENGWLQYDNQIGTFRGEVSGVTYGNYTNEFSTAESLLEAIGITLNISDLENLAAEKASVE